MVGGGGSVQGFRAGRFRTGIVVGSAGAPVSVGVGVRRPGRVGGGSRVGDERVGTGAVRAFVGRLIVVRNVNPIAGSAVRAVRRAVPELGAGVGERLFGRIRAGAVGVPLAVAVGVGCVG